MATSDNFSVQPWTCGECKVHFRNVPRHGLCVTCTRYLCQGCYKQHLLDRIHHELTEEQDEDRINNVTVPQDDSSVSHSHLFSKEYTELHKMVEEVEVEINTNQKKSSDFFGKCQRQLDIVIDIFNDKVKQKRDELREVQTSSEKTMALAAKDCQTIKTELNRLTPELQSGLERNNEKLAFDIMQESREHLIKIRQAVQNSAANVDFEARVSISDNELQFKIKTSSPDGIMEIARWDLTEVGLIPHPEVPLPRRSKRGSILRSLRALVKSKNIDVKNDETSQAVKSLTWIRQVLVTYHTGEQKCKITHATVLSDHRLALIDTANACIKILDRANKIVDTCIDLSEQAYCISESGFQYLVVSIPDQNSIIEINTLTKEKKTHRCKYTVYSLTRMGEHLVCTVAETNRSNSIVKHKVILKRAGISSSPHVLYTSTCTLDDTEANVLQVSANNEHGILYIINKNKQKIIGMDVSGKKLSTIKGLDGVSGISIDTSGFVYVSFGHSPKMLQFAPNLKAIRKIQVPEHKLVVFSNSEGLIFFVTPSDYLGDHDKVEVYRLQ